jgi:hypothetical protein
MNGFNSIIPKTTLKIMNIKSLVAVSSSVVCAIGFLNAQVPDYQNIKLPSGYKQQMEKMQKQVMKNAGIETDESSLSLFMAKIKTVKIAEDTPDDVINKLGKPYNRSKWEGTETLNYSAMPEVGTMIMTSIQIGRSGKVTSVKVSKAGNQGSSELYSKGAFEMSGVASGGSQSSNVPSASDHFPLKETAPDNPTEGQIYFNKTDKHFYGWDGTAWLKLDTKP